MFSHIDPRLKQLGEDKIAEWRQWFDTRLDDAIEAADYQGTTTTIIECRFQLNNNNNNQLTKTFENFKVRDKNCVIF